MSQNGPRSLRVAVADDDAEMLRYYQTFLPRFGHQVVAVAEDGEELIRVCRSCAPDLVISDIIMPKLDGLTAHCQIGLPFIIVSGQAEPQWPEELMQNRCLAYLVKPIKQTDLKAALDAALTQFEAAPRTAPDSVASSRDVGLEQ